MRRTQLYLDDDLWTVLRLQARIEKTTVSELVRRAVRERYSVDREKRKQAMEAVIGIWKDRTDIGDSTEYVRKLRRGKRLKRLMKQMQS
jgi:Arc/MetJ family transcription regulator